VLQPEDAFEFVLIRLLLGGKALDRRYAWHLRRVQTCALCRLGAGLQHKGEAVALERADNVRSVAALDWRLIRRRASSAAVHEDLELVARAY
jgi:hypothetical protein